MGWLIAGYVIINLAVMGGWCLANEENRHMHTWHTRSTTFIIASGFVWPLHLLWTLVRGLPEVFHVKRGPVELSRKDQREVMKQKALLAIEQERVKTQREYNSLIGAGGYEVER